jgi:hypothetical protein
MEEGKRKETAVLEVHRTQLLIHQATERSGDGGLPTNLGTSSEHVWFDLSSQKVVAAHLSPLGPT